MNGLEIISVLFIAAAVVLVMIRLLIGPQAPDRLVAADTLSMIVTVVLVAFALWFPSPLYLDVALIYSVLAFVGIVAIARAIEGGRS